MWSARRMGKVLWLVLPVLALAGSAAIAQEPATANAGQPRTVLKTTVRRVVLDVTVTDANDHRRPGEGRKTRAGAAGDTLSVNMQHGAPMAHALVFVVQAHTAGPAAPGTPQQMAELATEPAYFKSRRPLQRSKPMPPVALQKDVFSFNIPVRQCKAEAGVDLEIAAAAYNMDGDMMNAVVSVANQNLHESAQSAGGGQQPWFFRMEQQLEVPVGAVTLRFAVRDRKNDRVGAMEIALPLAEEPAQNAGSVTGAH